MRSQGYTTFSLPTLSNPDAIDNVDELRRELHLANHKLLSLSVQHATLAERAQTAFDSEAVLMQLAAARLSGHTHAVLSALDKLAACAQIEAAPEARMH